jgi:hypothetical protein
LEYNKLKLKHDCVIDDHEKENKKHQTENLELKNEIMLLRKYNEIEKTNL